MNNLKAYFMCIAFKWDCIIIADKIFAFPQKTMSRLDHIIICENTHTSK